MLRVAPRPVRVITTFASVAAIVLSLVTGVGASQALADPTPAPSTSAVPTSAEEAQRAKDEADRKVAELQERIGKATKRINALSAAAAQAQDEYKAQLPVQARAEAAEAAARAALEAARRNYEHARDLLYKMMLNAYTSGTGIDSSGASAMLMLLLTTDPNTLLDAASYGELASAYHAQVTQQMIDAVARKTAAEERQKQALAEVTRQTEKLEAIHKRAQRALKQAEEALKALRADMLEAKMSQAEAVATLSMFIGGWSIADPVAAAALNAQYAAMAASAAALPMAKSKGKWTPGLGRSAVNRALQWIGTPYAWAGGNAHGPTRGVCTGGDGANDCNVVGFDCSGLVLYAWAPYKSMAHFAATQYAQAGSVHPAVGELLPGDLVFWSEGGAGAIHHVAMYVGDGNVLQAPRSGDIVRITPLGNVSAGYFGATRPMT